MFLNNLRRRASVPLLCAALLSTSLSPLRGEDLSPDQLAEMNLEQLLGATVTSVARREEQLARSPAAIHVISNEEIRRSGATNLPELLRSVPGIEVARIDAHNWAISARGFNDTFSNKLLVLIDGRSVYTPLFSGVNWDAQDVMLEDVERVEVIRGPGAALWGANAVNGVINVITKSAAATQGLLITGGGGNEELGFGSIRYGGAVGDNFHYRVFGKFSARDDSVLSGGDRANDDWQTGRGGFRLDWDAAPADLLTLQGQIYRLREDQVYRRLRPAAPFTAYEDRSVDSDTGGDVLARWTHTFSQASSFSLQTYYDQWKRKSATSDEKRGTFDVDLQHRFGWGDRQTIVWGGGYRRTTDHIGSTFDLTFAPAERTDELLNTFVHDEIALVKERLTLTLGSKFEWNDYTGFEFQPNARLLWTPGDKHSIWASVSRAVRTPSRAEEDVGLRGEPVIPPGALFAGYPPYVPPSPAIVTAVRGSRGFDSETLIAYEAGYRFSISSRLSVDLSAFYNDYDQLRSIDARDPFLDPATSPPQLTLLGGNAMWGQTYGGEVTANLRLTDWWRIRADYSLLQMQLHLPPGSLDTGIFTDRGIEKSNPQNQFALHSWIDLPHGFEFDATVRYVDSLPTFHIPAYVGLDLRLGWRPTKHVEISVVGQGLLDRSHPEFAPSFVPTQKAEVETSIFGKVTIRF